MKRKPVVSQLFKRHGRSFFLAKHILAVADSPAQLKIAPPCLC